MRIKDIKTHILRLPEVAPNGDGLQDVLILEVETDEGLVGVGEVHTAPSVARAIIDAPVSQMTVQGFRQLLIGRDPRRINELWHLMYHHSTTYGRRGIVINTISGIDIALWDLLGKTLDTPVHQILGGAIHDELTVYASDLTPTTLEGIIDLAHRHVAAGYTATKFGWGGLGVDVREDVLWMSAVRKAVGSDVRLMLDMGNPVSFERAVWLAQALAEYDLDFLEEPLSPDDLDGYKALVKASPTPIATGEKETTRFGFLDLMERGGLRIVQPDLARIGGITEMCRIAALAELRNVRVIPHCWATDILVAATSHFLSTLKQPALLEYNVMENPLRTDLLTKPLRPHDGVLAVPTGPGLGVTLNRDTLDRYRWEPA